jgi:transposase
MARKATTISSSLENQQELERLAGSRTESKQMVDRAKMILGCLSGKRVKEVARGCGTRPNTVIKWRDRFARGGLLGLRDAPRPGAKRVYGDEFRKQVLALLEQPPPDGQACWDGPAVAERLGGVSVHAVWRVLRRQGICLQRQRSWCVSTDKEFAAKAADIVGLYLDPPENAFIISVDEKPSIQALERKTGYVQTDSGKIVRAYKSTYKRHGTLNLFAALTVATGEVKTQITQFNRERKIEPRIHADEH